MKKTFLNGLTTGLTLQFAIGLVFFFILNVSLQRTFLDALFAVFAVTLVDYIYISLAILGVGRLLQKEKIKKVLTIVSGIVLVVFGIFILKSAGNSIDSNVIIEGKNSNLINSFSTAFLLTISSPLTIVFWTSIFTSRSIELGLSSKELTLFGFAAGLATLIFLSAAVAILSIVGSTIPPIAVTIANIAVGLVLIVYGIIRIFSKSKEKD